MDDVFRIRTAKKYDIEITDEELKQYGIEPEVSRTLSEEFSELMKEQPNIVEKTLSDALLEELEAEIEQEEALKENKQVKSTEESEDEWEMVEDKNIPSVENKKPKKFGLFGGTKLNDIPTKALLLQFGKMINERNFYSKELKLINDKKTEIMNNTSLSAEQKKERILRALRSWINARNGAKPTEYAEKIKTVNNRINTLSKYLKEKREVNPDDLESIENGWEPLQEEEIEEAKRSSSSKETKQNTLAFE